MTDDDSDTIINQQILFNLAQYKVSHPGDACAEVLFNLLQSDRFHLKMFSIRNFFKVTVFTFDMVT